MCRILGESLPRAHSGGHDGSRGMWKSGVLGEVAGVLNGDGGVHVDHVDDGEPVA